MGQGNLGVVLTTRREVSLGIAAVVAGIVVSFIWKYVAPLQSAIQSATASGHDCYRSSSRIRSSSDSSRAAAGWFAIVVLQGPSMAGA